MLNQSKQSKKRKKRVISKKRELIKASILILLIATALRVFVVFPQKLPDDAMQNSLYSGDFMMVSKITYKFNSPAIGDLVVFDHPFRPEEKLARRVIATAGQTVEIVGKMVYINDEPISDYPSVTHSDYRILPSEFSTRDYCPPQQVPSGQVYVLADNRDQAEDSRDFGFVDLSVIKGKSLFVYFSWAPDPNAPVMESPYIIPAIQLFFYNLFHFPSRIRWDRFFVTS
ncbi:MAG: signal peptidase I [candidate division Zixibacteria bacterium]